MISCLIKLFNSNHFLYSLLPPSPIASQYCNLVHHTPSLPELLTNLSDCNYYYNSYAVKHWHKVFNCLIFYAVVNVFAF